jgi:hypothetical protein
MSGGRGFSRFYPEGNEPVSVLIARATIALNALCAIDPHEAEGVARAFLSGALTPKPKDGKVVPWKRS